MNYAISVDGEDVEYCDSYEEAERIAENWDEAMHPFSEVTFYKIG